MGYTIDGKYVVDRVLGEGGMGVVYAAHHKLLGIDVALKVLRPALVAHDDAVRRVTREAQSMARLSSPHVARVLDAGAGPEGSPYLVLELLEGEDLGTRLKQRGPLRPEEAASHVLEACLGLAEAHAVGVIHRDLKPANLFLATLADGSAVIKIVDFGISKLVDNAEVTLTSPETLLGSPAYMAPEQMASAHHVDGRADIWSLGAILFRLVSGQHIFVADSSYQRLHALLKEEPRRLRQVAPEAPAELEAIVARCLVRDPNGRYSTVADLAADLAAFLGRPAPHLPGPHLSTTPPPQVAPIREVPTRRDVRRGGRGKLWGVLLLSIGLAGVALFATMYRGGRSVSGLDRTSAPATPPPTQRLSVEPSTTTPPSTDEPVREPTSTSALPIPSSTSTPSASAPTATSGRPPATRPLGPSLPSSSPFDGRL